MKKEESSARGVSLVLFFFRLGQLVALRRMDLHEINQLLRAGLRRAAHPRAGIGIVLGQLNDRQVPEQERILGIEQLAVEVVFAHVKWDESRRVVYRVPARGE